MRIGRIIQRRVVCALFCITVLWPGFCLAQTSTSVPELEMGLQATDYQPRHPEVWTMPNGLTVMYLHDDELPLVQGTLFIHGGAIWETTEPVGTSAVMGDQMRQGGAGNRSADALDRELERLAAGVGSSFGAEYGKISFYSLHSDLEPVFSIFSDVILRPRFERERLELWRGQALEGIRRRTDDPGTIAGIAFNQLLYGNTVYGRVSADKDVRSLSRDHLLKAYRKLVVPQRAILTMSGKVEQGVARALIEKHLGKWQARGGPLAAPPPVEWQPKPNLYFLSYPFAQATMLVGKLGPKRLTPDYPAIEVFNEIFGAAGFSARLTKRVRTELGLAYGIFGAILPAVEKGRALIQLQTKAESAGQALLESLRVLKSMQENPVTEHELFEARRSISNSFVFKFDTTDELTQRAALLRLLDYPADYDDTYVDRIMAVTPDETKAVALRYWDPTQFVVVVVGNETAYTALEKALATEHGKSLGLSLQRVRFDQKLIMP